jgi:hypothetical protein
MSRHAVLIAAFGMSLVAGAVPVRAEGVGGLLNMISASRPVGMRAAPVTDPEAFRRASASDPQTQPQSDKAAMEHMERNAALRHERAQQLMAEQAKIDAQNAALAAEANARAAAEQREYYRQLAEQERGGLAPVLPGATAPAAPAQAAPASAAQQGTSRPSVYVRPKSTDPEKPVRLFNTRKKETAE